MAEARFRHADSEKWHEVRAIEIAGRRASVWEKWLEFTPELLCLHARWDPGMMVHKHGHNSPHVLYVLAGEMTCGDVRCTPGMHIALPQGAAFGPFVAGPQGVELFEVMMGDPRSWPADPEGFAKLLAERRAVKLPDPPIELPDWLETLVVGRESERKFSRSEPKASEDHQAGERIPPSEETQRKRMQKGFKVFDDGMDFLTIRTGEARVAIEA